MYLEISPRRTGKTHRLINEIIRYHLEYQNGKILLFCPNHDMSMEIKNRLMRYNILNNKIIDILSNSSFENTLSIDEKDKINEQSIKNYLKLFVDEFNYCNLFKNKFDILCESFPVLVKNGVFVSTYEDSLIQHKLIGMNGDNYYTMSRNIGA